MANTTWSTTDRVNMTISGSNLTATGAGGNGCVRSADFQTTGKYYWELSCATLNQTSTLFGIGNASAALSALTSLNACFTSFTGAVQLNGADPGVSIPALTPGTGFVYFALDMTAKLLWMKSSAAGQWWSSGTANPATGVGGLNIAGITSTGIFAMFAATATNERTIANFGDSAFSGVVPSGFTAGFPASTISLSGVREMAFTAGPTVVLGAGAAVALPAGVDVSGINPSFTLYSHMRVPGGTTYTFDSGQVLVVPATTDSVIAIPTGARFITATAASTVQFGQSL